MTEPTCGECHDTRRVPISDDDATWDDDRCPMCGGRFVYPVCLANDCLLTRDRRPEDYR